MRNIYTILIAVLLLSSGMKVSINRHYCGGKLASTKISVTGKPATCGMEEKGRACSDQPSINNKCCEDQVTWIGIDTRYIPEYFKLSSPLHTKDVPAFPMYNDVKLWHSDANIFTSWVFPPGIKLKSGLSLSEICVFRI